MNEQQKRAAQIVLDYLEENNSHTIGKLLAWELLGKGDDEKMSRALELAKNFIYYN